MFTTPILLITFNRPDHVRRVLPEILKQDPLDLYVCQDGAREGNENDRIKCQEVRDVVKELTAPYAAEHKEFTLHTLYHKQNFGCGRGPYEAMSWFFRNVEKGIILEDGTSWIIDTGFVVSYKPVTLVDIFGEDELIIGTRGEYVKNLQLALQGMGYYDGKIDGIFGAETKKAVKKFGDGVQVEYDSGYRLNIKSAVKRRNWSKILT